MNTVLDIIEQNKNIEKIHLCIKNLSPITELAFKTVLLFSVNSTYYSYDWHTKKRLNIVSEKIDELITLVSEAEHSTSTLNWFSIGQKPRPIIEQYCTITLLCNNNENVDRYIDHDVHKQLYKSLYAINEDHNFNLNQMFDNILLEYDIVIDKNNIFQRINNIEEKYKTKTGKKINTDYWHGFDLVAAVENLRNWSKTDNKLFNSNMVQHLQALNRKGTFLECSAYNEIIFPNHLGSKTNSDKNNRYLFSLYIFHMLVVDILAFFKNYLYVSMIKYRKLGDIVFKKLDELDRKLIEHEFFTNNHLDFNPKIQLF